MIVEDFQISDWLEQCNDRRGLEFGDPRFIELENRAGPGAPQQGDWITPFFNCIKLHKKPTCQLFSGYMGTGKSTCLHQLKHRLEKAGYLVLLVDAADYHDLDHSLAIDELMILTAGAIGEQVSEQVGKNLVAQSYWDRFLTFLKAEIDIKELNVPIPATGGNLKVALKSADASFWMKVSEVLSVSIKSLKQSVDEYIGECIGTLRQHYANKYPQGVVFILDSLERLRGDQSQFQPIMDSVVKVFAQYKDFLRLPDCHVIYTVPPYIHMLRRINQDYEGGSKFPLPAIKVYDPDNHPYEPGIRDLMLLVAKRVPLDTVFGVDSSKSHTQGEAWDAFQNLILSSGGHVRTLLKMVYDILFENVGKDFPVQPETIERVVATHRQLAEMAVDADGHAVLAEISETNSREGIPDRDLPQLARFMDSQAVLWYQNGDGWFAVHPLIWNLVERRKRKVDDQS